MKSFSKILSVFCLVLGLLLIPNFLLAQGNGKGKGKGKGKGSEMHQGQGQSPKSIEQRARNRADFWTKKLGLTADQNSRTYEVLLSALQKTEDIKASVKGSERKSLLAEVRAKKEEALRSIFTVEQYAMYVKMKEEKKKNNSQGGDDDDGDDDAPVQSAPKSEGPVKGGAVKGGAGKK